MAELDFTLEFNSDVTNGTLENELFVEADRRLRELAEGHDDLIGAAINIRTPAQAETPPLYEATVVAYVRPENLAATEKSPDVYAALKGALDAVERQIRQKREKLGKRWEQPAGHPVIREMIEVEAAKGEIAEVETANSEPDDG
jgi:ribosome-associated translation inhibitor RaiA